MFEHVQKGERHTKIITFGDVAYGFQSFPSNFGGSNQTNHMTYPLRA